MVVEKAPNWAGCSGLDYQTVPNWEPSIPLDQPKESQKDLQMVLQKEPQKEVQRVLQKEPQKEVQKVVK